MLPVYRNFSLNIFLDDLFEAMIYVKNTENYDNKKSSKTRINIREDIISHSFTFLSEIDNLKVIHEIAQKLGLRCQIIAAPGSEKLESIINKDVVKRY